MALQPALAVLFPVIEAVSALPFNGKGVQEKLDGIMDFEEQGVWIFSFKEDYGWTNSGWDDFPHSSRAEVQFGIQVRKKWLDTIIVDKPQQAIASMTNSLRVALQTASAAGTFRDSVPSFKVRMLDSEQMFSEVVGLGVIQVTLELKGFD